MWRLFLESTCLCGGILCLDTVSDRVIILERALVFCLSDADLFECDKGLLSG